ncbi:MAG: UDP-3-O-(3-hydroxymyristoyl)glucosamine N-acyltransferase [bacterium]
MTSKSNNRHEYTLQELAERLQGRVLGKGDITISGIAGLEEAQAGDITFLANPRYRPLVSQTQASALIASQEEPSFGGPVLQVPDPYLAFAMLLEAFYPSHGHVPGVHETAVVQPDARIGKDVCIEPGAVIAPGVVLGDRVWIGACAVVGEDSSIGNDTRIHPNVTIYPDTRIGERVIIHAGVVIGSDGFGYARKDGLPYKVPQVGGVVIEDDCEIGANTTIDRGTLGDTRIGKGTKIDNLVQVGHNVSIGPYSILVAQVGVSGSARIGKGVVLAGQSGVAGHIQIGDGVTVAGKSAVTKSIPAGETVGGFMAFPIREWRKAEAVYRRLPDLQDAYRRLVKRLDALEALLRQSDQHPS